MFSDLWRTFRRRRRRTRLAHEVPPPSARTRFLVRGAVAFAVFAATLFMFPLQVRFEPPAVLEGTIASDEIIAPFAFPVPKDDGELARERALAAETVFPTFAQKDQQAQVNRAVAELDRARRDPRALDRHLQLAGLHLTPETVYLLSSPDSGSVLMRELGGLLTEAETSGLVADDDLELLSRHPRLQLSTSAGASTIQSFQIYDYRRLDELAAIRGEEQLGDMGAGALRELVRSLARPNVTYDHLATERERAAARADVNPVRETIQEGERIVDAHERITAEHVTVLGALESAMRERTTGGGLRAWLSPLVGRALLVTIMIVLIAVSLHVSRPKVWASLKLVTLLGTVSLLTLAAAAAIARTPNLHPFLIPVPLAAILVMLLVDDIVAVIMVTWLSALIGTVTGWGLSVTLVGFVGGIAGVYSVRGVTHRMEIYRSMLLVALAVTGAVVGVLLVGPTLPWSTLWREVVWAVGNAVVCTALAVLILPVFEKGFDLVTNISLLEYSDLNRPIFKRMMLEANGTYHHSMVIGSLAEAASEAVGANPLLARVGAYYHDIGKIAKSSYFGENLRKGSRNPHERLTPTMSGLILESHVREGLELAREIGLPTQVAAFIPEHQGTTLMQYFYNKALEMDPEVEERDYRYPGPKPQCRETAIVMLGDGAEATVRSLDDQSPNRIRAVLDKIFAMRIVDGQLDESGLSVSDLPKIREAFTHVLTGVFHGRVKYQWQKDGGEAQLGPSGAERVFHPELETGLGTAEVPGHSGTYATVSSAADKKARG